MQHPMQTQTTAPAPTAVPEDFQPGTLMQLNTSAARWHHVPFRTAITLGALKAGSSYMGLVWFWTEGEPEFTRTIRTVMADQVTPARTTLTDMPEGAYWRLREQYEAAQDAAAATGAAEHQQQAARFLESLAGPLEAAELARYGRVSTASVRSQPCEDCTAGSGTECVPMVCTAQAGADLSADDLSGYLSEPCTEPECQAAPGQDCKPACPNRI